MLPWLTALLVLFVSSLYFPFHSNSHVLLDQARSNASRILLLTAHPDDECLFFAPTVLALREHPAHPEIFSLTLSIGNAAGFGEVRKEELSRSLDVMGIDQDNRWVVDHPMLQDNMTLEWDASVIAVVIAPYVVDNHITTILTFDTQGISSHPNHYSLPFGAWDLANILRAKAPEPTSFSVPRVFSLVTVPLLSKYAGVLAPLSSRMNMILQRVLNRFTQSDGNQQAVFTSGFTQYVTAVRAMQKHTTQLEWFRYLYVTFSRYMWINDWVEVKSLGKN
ncbi:LmbE-like protein [Boletus edulis BED1]|uniref:N-acetylglucosaminylphosphatidylinositol deacetylase n=1 Tax=Boletus edulis BED1 TaxID=1328754 RepID=A0AAD4GEA3_BOLED|nr:LmbE-like protein [Boletus edulis BED1]